MIQILFAALLFAAPQAHATSLESDTTLATETSTEAVSGDGNFGAESPWIWNLGGSYTKTTTPATTTSPQIIDKTTGLTTGFGWEQDFMAGLGIAYSATPDERLDQFGPNIYVGYNFKLGSSPQKPVKKTQPEKSLVDQEDDELDASEKKEFVPSLSVRVPLGQMRFRIQPLPVTATKRRALAPAPIAAEIIQKSGGLELGYDALVWLSLRASYVKYKYDRDVNKFVANLDSPRAVRAGISGFGSTVSGLPLDLFSFGVGLTPLDNWSFDFDDAITTQATDRSKSRAVKLMATRELGESWKVGLGLENEHSVSLNENLLLIKVVYDF